MDAQEDRRLPDFEREENAGRAEDPIFHVDSLRGGLNDGEDHALQRVCAGLASQLGCSDRDRVEVVVSKLASGVASLGVIAKVRFVGIPLIKCILICVDLGLDGD